MNDKRQFFALVVLIFYHLSFHLSTVRSLILNSDYEIFFVSHVTKILPIVEELFIKMQKFKIPLLFKMYRKNHVKY